MCEICNVGIFEAFNQGVFKSFPNVLSIFSIFERDNSSNFQVEDHGDRISYPKYYGGFEGISWEKSGYVGGFEGIS